LEQLIQKKLGVYIKVVAVSRFPVSRFPFSRFFFPGFPVFPFPLFFGEKTGKNGKS
jgi:hypothetical protein